jgi:hypothetical protein
MKQEKIEKAMSEFLDRLHLLNERHRNSYKEIAKEVFGNLVKIK